MRRRVEVLGCSVDALSMRETVEAVADAVRTGAPAQHVAVNAAKIARLRRDPELRRIVGIAHLVSADGVGVLWAARRSGTPLPERVAGVDLMLALLERSDAEGWRPFFLGGRPGVARDLEAWCRHEHPALEVAGTHHGHFPPDSEEGVAATVAASGAHVLFVALGTPRQERFVHRWKDRMGVPFCMGVGGGFDAVTGRVPRAPAWVRERGLEWAWRTLRQPSRLVRRKTFDTLAFAVDVLRRTPGLGESA